MSKTRAARISNAEKSASKRGGRKREKKKFHLGWEIFLRTFLKAI